MGLTVVPGVRLHTALAMFTLQETVTLWLNDPAAVTWKLVGDEVAPRGTVTFEGEGVVSAKLTITRVSGISCVV